MTDMNDFFNYFLKNKLVLATAESCTGGMIASCITDIAGSSAIFDRGFVTYSNQAKIDMLGVKQKTLDQYGAVSSQTASEMVQGALKNSLATIAISVTGIAGPTGGTIEKPIGLVWFGFQKKGQKPITVYQKFKGNRTDIRLQATHFVLEFCLN